MGNVSTSDLGIGSSGIKKEVIDSMIKQIAKETFKMKQAVAIVPTSAWTNTFFRENTAILEGKSGNTTDGLARGANFPQANQSWKEVSVKIIKYGQESNIAWETILASDINTQARTVIALTEAVVSKVDNKLYESLSQGDGKDSDIVIQSFAIGVQKYWNGSSGAIVDDMMKAKQVIGQAPNNYDTGNLLCFISPRDERAIAKHMADKGTQWEPIATDIARNGAIAKIGGVTLIVSNSVTASYALVVKPKTCATYNELVSLRSTTIEDPYKSITIRVVEEGSLSLTDPLSIVLIKGTQGVDGL